MSTVGSPPPEDRPPAGLSVNTGPSAVSRPSPSPASVAGSEWSGFSRYGTDSMYSQPGNGPARNATDSIYSQPGAPPPRTDSVYSQPGNPPGHKSTDSIYSQPGKTPVREATDSIYSQPANPPGHKATDSIYSQPANPPGHKATDSIYSQPGAPPPRTDSVYSQPGAHLPRTPGSGSPPGSLTPRPDSSRPNESAEGPGTLKAIANEEEVAQHHAALQRLLQPYLAERGLTRPTKARAKLLRLSPVQFQELSTDVYDELNRRQEGHGEDGAPPPPHLLPKPNFHPKRNQARQKLSTLPDDRFRDLATDVFGELERRFPRFNSGLLRSPTPSERGEMTPVGMGMPPPLRINSPGPGRIGSGGYGGMTGSPGLRPYGPPRGGGYRGPPRGPPGGPGMPVGPPGQGGPDSPNSLGRPLPRTFQNNMVIPNKSTMVEDDDDEGAEVEGYQPGRRSSARSAMTNMTNGPDPEGKRLIDEQRQRIRELEDKISSLESTIDDKEIEIQRLRNAADTAAEIGPPPRLLEDLEAKLQDAETLNASLQTEITRVKTENEAHTAHLNSRIAQLEAELASPQTISYRNAPDDSSMAETIAQLQRQNAELTAELREQEEVTEEVRREATEFLAQMKLISDRADTSYEREQHLQAEIDRLNREIAEWKTRYAKAKTTIRSIRHSSMGLQVPSSGLLGKDMNLVDARGKIRAVALTKFQIAIDELLRVARSINFHASLDAVTTVVLATRALTADVASDNEEITRIKARISATANNLTTAAKNHAGGHGLSPVSLLDAAASHLTASVIELVKVCKIRPTTDEGDIQEEDEVLASAVTQIDDEAMTIAKNDPRFLSAINPSSFPTPPTGRPGSGEPLPRDDPDSSTTPMTRDSSNQSDWVRVDRAEADARAPSPARASTDSSYSIRSAKERKPSRNGISYLPDADRAAWSASLRAPPADIAADLRSFLENHAESITVAIQNLLSALRAPGPLPTADLAAVVPLLDEIMAATEAACKHNPAFLRTTESIVMNLRSCRERMVQAQTGLAALQHERGRGEGAEEEDEEEEEHRERGRRERETELKGLLARCAFDAARETKALVREVEALEVVDLS